MDAPLIGGIEAVIASRGIDQAQVLSFAKVEVAVDDWTADHIQPIMARRRNAGFDA
jgi:hypothetical protein